MKLEHGEEIELVRGDGVIYLDRRLPKRGWINAATLSKKEADDLADELHKMAQED